MARQPCNCLNRDGYPCKYKAISGSEYCNYHQNCGNKGAVVECRKQPKDQRYTCDPKTGYVRLNKSYKHKLIDGVPKKPPTGFNLFLKDYVKPTMKLNPDKGYLTILKTLSYQWKQPEMKEIRDSYIAKASVAQNKRREYIHQMAIDARTNPNSPYVLQKNGKVRLTEVVQRKEPGEQGDQGFMIFVNYTRPYVIELYKRNDITSGYNIQKIMADLWHQLPQEDKDVYKNYAQVYRHKKEIQRL